MGPENPPGWYLSPRYVRGPRTYSCLSKTGLRGASLRPSQENGGPEPEASGLREYLAILRLRKWSVTIVTALVVTSAFVFSVLQTPLYVSEAQVLVEPVTISAGQQGDVNLNMDTERRLAESSAVANLVVTKLKVEMSPLVLLSNVSVDVPTNTEILVIKYSDPDARTAQLRSQAFADAYLEFRRQHAVDELLALSRPLQENIQALSAKLDKLTPQIDAATDPATRRKLQGDANSLIAEIAILRQSLSQLTPPQGLEVGQLVEPADLPTSPSSPRYPVNLGLGLFVGLALGVAVAFLRDRLDDRIRGSDDLETVAGAPALGIVPKLTHWRQPREEVLVTLSEPHSLSAEAYRTLRASILFTASRLGIKTLLITSPSPGEGKSTTTANLGVALAQAGKNVILISADLRKPRLHRFFSVPAPIGLTDVLMGEASVANAIVQTEVDNLRLVSSGPMPGNHDAVLGSEAMAGLLPELREMADIILIDSAPVIVADTMTLGPLVDAVLLVTDASRTPRRAVREARQRLDQMRTELIGCVLNNVDHTSSVYASYGYGGVSTNSQGGRRETARLLRPSKSGRGS
jgi:tyrosine-protein kinase